MPAGELEALRDEVAATPAAPEPGATSSAPATGDNLPQASAELAGACGGLALAIGSAACKRIGVSELTPAEASSIGAALANVIVLYLPEGSPQAMRWLALFGAVSAVALPRVGELRAARARPVEPAPAPEPAAPQPQSTEVPPRGDGNSPYKH